MVGGGGELTFLFVFRMGDENGGSVLPLQPSGQLSLEGGPSPALPSPVPEGPSPRTFRLMNVAKATDAEEDVKCIGQMGADFIGKRLELLQPISMSSNAQRSFIPRGKRAPKLPRIKDLYETSVKIHVARTPCTRRFL